MMRVLIPRQPVPAELVEAVRVKRAAIDAAADAETRKVAEHDYAQACQAARDFVESVGQESVEVPREIEAKGPSAMEAFIAERQMIEEPPARRRRERAES